MRKNCCLAVLLLSLALCLTNSVLAAGDECEYAGLRSRLLQLERHLAFLSQTSELSAADRTRKADKLQAQIKDIKQQLNGKFAPADMALGEAVDAVQKHGSAWFLRYLSHGRYTGRKSEHHSPLEAVDIPAKNPDLAGRAALPLLGYPLMVILSYDPICREAYREFIPAMEDIVREMERRSGKPCDFWNREPTIIPNDLGWDFDRFWAFAQECSGKAVNRYFWNASPEEIRQATNIVSLVICTSFLNNVTIDVAGDKEAQSKKAFWRANAAPWFSPDKSQIRNKFHVFHFFTHGWLTYLKMFNDSRFDKGILTAREARPATKGMLKNAFRFSNVVGIGYEAISTFTGTKHGFLETSAVNELPRPLKKVAQALHLKKIVGYESVCDIADNREGAWFGAALYLSNHPLKLSAIAEHRSLVMDWQKALKERGENVEPETGGPERGQPRLLRGDRVSLFDLNTPEGKKRITSGFFREVYRGMGGFEPAAHAEAEVQAFRYLCGEDLLSYNLRQIYTSALATAANPKEAWVLAKSQHARLIENHFKQTDDGQRAGIFTDLYSNEATRTTADSYNQEADYVYATRKADVAGCYGPIVLTIREREPRGLDLNTIAKGYAYYSGARFLKNAVRLRWKTMLGDYVLDDDEYLLPSSVPSSEITGFVARSPKAKVVKSHIAAADKDFAIALKAPPILRRYEKKMTGGYLVIDVFDNAGKLIERLSESEDNTPPEESFERSKEKLPAGIRAAWNQYQQNTRR